MREPPKIIASLLTRRGWDRTVIRAGSRIHTALLRRFGRWRLVGADTLLLTTRGRRSGLETSTPLFYANDGERLLIAASYAGSGVTPAWYLNLTANPDVTVTLGGATLKCRARQLTETEVHAAWPKLLAVYPTYERYRKRAVREIPIVELSPAGPPDAAR